MSSKVLEYYKSAKHSELKGVINLEDCESLNAGLFHKKYKHVFDLRTKDRTYYLVASSSDEMESWVEVICKICNFSCRLSAAETGKMNDVRQLMLVTCSILCNPEQKLRVLLNTYRKFVKEKLLITSFYYQHVHKVLSQT